MKLISIKNPSNHDEVVNFHLFVELTNDRSFVKNILKVMHEDGLNFYVYYILIGNEYADWLTSNNLNEMFKKLDWFSDENLTVLLDYIIGLFQERGWASKDCAKDVFTKKYIVNSELSD